MSDYDIWKEFFDRYHIGYLEQRSDNNSTGIWKETISLETDEGHGYSGFSFVPVFNLDGSFKGYGVWE